MQSSRGKGVGRGKGAGGYVLGRIWDMKAGSHKIGNDRARSWEWDFPTYGERGNVVPSSYRSWTYVWWGD